MAAINAGTQITFEINGSTGEWIPRTPDDVRSAVIGELSYYGTVESLTIVKESSRLLAPLWDWRYSARLVIRTNFGHASINDLNAVIAAAFWTAAGEPATVTSPQYGQVQGSGIIDNSPDATTALLGVGSFTIIAAVAVAIFVLKRG